jgi:enoyl-CoA hydratase
MNYEQILYEMDGPVLRITCNRPKYRNAQSRRLLEELDDAFARASDDLDARVIVLLGAGDHFSGGHDLGTPEEMADRQARPYQDGIRGRFQRTREIHVEMTLRWRNVPKPTIAAVQGYCIFGGWMIASAMDVIFAADDAMFLGSNFQYFSIPWDMHPRKAKEILYASRFIDAPEALELGLVNQVIPRQQLLAETMAYANLVAQNDPFQLRMIKLAVNQHQDTQGFVGHINAAHALYALSSIGESDPDYALKQPEGRRRPMVQRAFENYAAHRNRRGDGA